MMSSIAAEIAKRLSLAGKGTLLALSFSVLAQYALTMPPALAVPSGTESRMLLGESQVPVRSWSDNSVQTKGIIVAVHGAARHSGTFEILAEHLASLGYLVACPDVRGHGQWVYAQWSTPQDKVVDWDKSTDDVVNLLSELHTQHPMLPIFCVGESAGAVVALRAAARYHSVNGLVLSSIGTTPCVHDMPKIFKDAIIGATNLNKPLDVRDILAKYSSEDEQVRLEAAKDPMGKNGLSARELLRTDWLLSRCDSYASRLPQQIPVLILQGDNDQIVKPSSARSVARHIGSKEKKYEIFHSGHILLSTPFIRPDVLTSVSDWLNTMTREQQTAQASGSSTIK